MSTARILLAVGISFEVLGIALVAAADWWPDALGVSAEVARRYKAVKAQVLNAFRNQHRSGASRVSAAGEVNTAGSITASKSPRPPGTVDERLARLEQESRQAMERLGLLEGDVRELPDAWRRDIGAARAELAELIDRRLTETEERYRRARQIGVVCLIVGLTFALASNAF